MYTHINKHDNNNNNDNTMNIIIIIIMFIFIIMYIIMNLWGGRWVRTSQHGSAAALLAASRY